MKQWYEKLFENYANKYDEEPFVQQTKNEVDFIEKELNFYKDMKILDIGCGTGRHTIELTQRGYTVMGIDLSENMLNRAKIKATDVKLNINFKCADARKLNYHNEFDAIIMLCEGAFPLMETDEMNYQILENAAKALKYGGKFIFTTLNGLYPLFHSVKEFINNNYDNDISNNHDFDLMTFRDSSEYEHIDDDGKKTILQCNERYYVPSEITWMLKTLKFSDISIFSCGQGSWSRENKLSTEDYEMLVVAEKIKEQTF